MAKLRKMLGDINSPAVRALMSLIETQSKTTLAAWAVGYAKERCLPLYAAALPGDARMDAAIAACEALVGGGMKLTAVKPLLREAAQAAREADCDPVIQAAARALSTACATVQTPTNALGFVFYAAAACAYAQAGLEQQADVYDSMAADEFARAHESLSRVAVPNEPDPAKIDWNC